MNKENKVYLIGSGPGDFGLLTIRAKELIERADILIYDNLINKKILSLCKNTCEKIYVGKSGAEHTLEQEDINDLLVKKFDKNKIIVRLKGGDPFIFGRGGEEALYLKEHGIAFEIVNGISSAYAVPAYAGIPVTHRGYAASVAFITGHEDPTKTDSDIHWDKIATGIQTLVFLMGVKNLPLIVEQLIKHGRSKDTPIAVIQKGSYPGQHTVVGTLSDIYEKVQREKIKPPSIIVVGEVVDLRDKINWFENKPLFGKSIIVTRSRDQASKVVSELTELGAEVIELPSIKIVPPDDTDIIFRCIKKINTYDWIIFTSVNGVEYFFKYFFELGYDSRKLSSNKICSIGSATSEKLYEFGIKPDIMPEKFVSDQIINALSGINEIKNRSFLLPRADIAPDFLNNALIEAGAKLVDNISIYKTVEEEFEEKSEMIEILKKTKFDLVTFTSSSTAVNFSKILKKLSIEISDKITCAAIGPVTAKTAEELGFSVKITAATHTIDGLIDAIVTYYK